MTTITQQIINEHKPDSMEELLAKTVELDASDLHLTYGEPPVFRMGGDLRPMSCEAYAHEEIRALLGQVMPPRYATVLEEKRSVDFAVSSTSVGRFRFAAYYQRGALSVAIRLLAKGIPDFQSLGLPASMSRLPTFRDGLVLVTGVTGSGKSTTLAAIIDAINRAERKNIITVEDPIEYVHQNCNCIINQRELHTDVHSFPDALRDSLRADPDVILVGEIRDLDTMRTAIMAAETGHLVFSTLHSKDAMSSVNRMVGSFPAGEQTQIRQQLSSTLRAVVSQRLLLRADKSGRVPAVELMFSTTGISNLIRLAKDDMIYSAIETGQCDGMQTMEQSLIGLMEAGLISSETALLSAKNQEMMRNRLTLRGLLNNGTCTIRSRVRPVPSNVGNGAG
ncbi:type IV pilus twitching motility protein PilT [Desulfonatronum sp. SC1]|uniref:type IV pilus twitching motility protein PilT n=1 Tax=Desulfonatronum sp. SC1 TaxID=2109626 RepID=UPI000D3268E6|nr:PilT/PilU family type 4a pilus ATPase [Desulfonatronum sp. SC1]PTN32588.1 type IV pili twitching motility protein PilT [Desulfonatronum sp. SC1]